jgi:hypothetical protein
MDEGCEERGNGKKNTVLNYISMIVLILVMVFMAVVLFWLLYPYKVVEVTNLRVTPVQATTGTTLHATFHVKKYTDDTGVVNWALQDGVNYVLLSGTTSSKKGEFDTERAILINVDVPAGKYHLILSGSYKVNPVKTVTYHFKCLDAIEIIK